jgi:hypothetical protein
MGRLVFVRALRGIQTNAQYALITLQGSAHTMAQSTQGIHELTGGQAQWLKPARKFLSIQRQEKKTGFKFYPWSSLEPHSSVSTRVIAPAYSLLRSSVFSPRSLDLHNAYRSASSCTLLSSVQPHD